MSVRRQIRAAVCGRNLEDLSVLLESFPIELVEDDPDLVISYGGDGSLLGAERSYPGVPKFALRDWRANPKCEAHEDRAVLDMLVKGKLSEAHLSKLVAETQDGQRLRGLNDVVVNKGIISSGVRYGLWLGEELYKAQIVADGLVVSTPFGSTGYYRSITHSTFRVGIGLAFNNSTEPIDHIVIGDDVPVVVKVIRGPALLVADNDPHHVPLNEGQVVTVTRDEQQTVVLGLDVFRCKECYRLRQDGVA